MLLTNSIDYKTFHNNNNNNNNSFSMYGELPVLHETSSCRKEESKQKFSPIQISNFKPRNEATQKQKLTLNTCMSQQLCTTLVPKRRITTWHIPAVSNNTVCNNTTVACNSTERVFPLNSTSTKISFNHTHQLHSQLLAVHLAYYWQLTVRWLSFKFDVMIVVNHLKQLFPAGCA